MDEKGPVELADEQLGGVAGGYNWAKKYKKDDTMGWFCTDCGAVTEHICTSPTTVTTNGIRGWTYETTWVCSVCGKGEPFVMQKKRY